ncbi:DUF3368 domain-containing protein [Nostoc sp.]|uniref:DUF3368 domain-containing protein n=1 Tax=Nostoc sp. TaxID=1180 RepID=UPI002FF6C4F5
MIVLLKSQQTQLLPQLFTEILVPLGVFALGINTIGTGGLLILAKRRGLIPSISPGIQALRDAGLWLSDTLVNLLKTSTRRIAIAINCNFK